MSDTFLMAIVFSALVLIVLLTLILRRLNRLLKISSDQKSHDLIGLLKKNSDETTNGFRQFGKELREVNADNRKEINQVFKDLQDTLLKRISENVVLQKTQLDSFSRSLNELSDKLARNSTAFKESITKLFHDSDELRNRKQDEFTDKTNRHFIDFNDSIRDDAKDNRKELKEGLKTFGEGFNASIKDFREQLQSRFAELNKQQSELNKLSNSAIFEVKTTIEKQLKTIRDDNATQLNEMRKTVDEKLQTTLEKRLGESFKQVSDRLEVVHKGLGEMQTLASGVGDLKKVLSNVKTRGILGEYQLANILEQMLSPNQYAKNVATKKGSQANVEFAIRLPGNDEGEEVWIPVDSKYPLESYNALQDAHEEGTPSQIEHSQKQLFKTIVSFAKEISEKYIDPPHTTDFAIMFLPIEGLYAEVLRDPGLFDKLQREYHITITGPTTLSALLNSLQMGYRTLAIQKRSSEVWKVLSAVKTEFGNFSGQLSKVHKQLNTATISLETLQSTRTNIMERKLQSVETIDALEAKRVLSLPKNEGEEILST